LNDKLSQVEGDAGLAAVAGKDVEALCARLDTAIKLRTSLLARRL